LLTVCLALGVMKNIINSGIGAFKFFATPHVKGIRITCMGMSHLTYLFNDAAAKAIRAGCRDAFKAFNVSYAYLSALDHDFWSRS